ncbi:MAG: hypothetical protein ACI856_002644 [Kiritimatiellia bacterium]
MSHVNRKALIMTRFFCLLLVLLSPLIASAGHGWDGSGFSPLHKIPLTDENGKTIYPDEDDPMPISTRNTCGACHDYDTISSGWHFNPDGDLEGRATEPWVVVDEKSGTQIPVSLRNAEGTWAMEQLGMTDWDFTKTFGRHMPGGSTGEGPHGAIRPDDRWAVSGNLEINCFACHNMENSQDLTEWVKQVARENFRWAATASSGLGEVPGTAERLSNAWVPDDGPDPDDLVYRVPPSVTYDHGLFDTKNVAVLDVGKPTDARCLQCHSAAEVHTERHQSIGDVHTVSGMSCVSCHRNGLDHGIERGHVGAFSCAGCHMGEAEHVSVGATEDVGTFGAPVPAHKGLPPIHLEKLACTTCHSGAWSKEGPVVVRTSKINRLGIHGRAQWFTEAPVIVEPVFKPDATGKIAPHRMMWPAFWAQRSGEELVPLTSESVMVAVGDVINPAGVVARVLSALGRVKDQGGSAYGRPVFLSGDKVYVMNLDGGLTVMPFEGDVPDSFSLGYYREKALVPIAAAYDVSTDGAFYYLGEAEQAHVKSVLETLGDIAPESAAPVWMVDGKAHKLARADYEQLSKDEYEALVKTAADLKTSAAALALQLDVAVESGKFYKKSDRSILNVSKSKTPELYELKKMVRDRDKADKAVAELEVFGDTAYRNVYSKGVAEYVVVEDATNSPAQGTQWGWIQGDAVNPLVSAQTAGHVRDTVGGEYTTFTEPQIAAALHRLGADHVYVANGKLFSSDDGKTLVASDHERAAPVAWPVGHDVRPAAQSLGAKSCADCHSPDATFFTASVVAQGPLKTDQGDVRDMSSHMELDGDYNRMFSMAFLARPLFKIVMTVLTIVTSLIILLYLLLGLNRITQTVQLPKIEALSMKLFYVSGIVLTITGFAAVFMGRAVGGYSLLLHMAFGGLFAVCLTVVAVLRSHVSTLGDGTDRFTCTQKVCFWILILCGVVLVLTSLLAMLPLAGTHGQHTLLQTHTAAGAVTVAAVVLYIMKRK